MPSFYLGKSNRPHNPINSISLAVSNHQAARISRFNRQNMTTGCTSCPCTGVDCNTTDNWCTGTYADCAGAVCQAIPNNPEYYLCNCLVTNGCSNAYEISCSQVAANGTTVYSTFSPYALIQNNLSSVVVNGGFTFAGCLGAKCIKSGNGTTATCTCPVKTTTPNENVNLWISSNPTLQQSQIQQIQSGQLIISAQYPAKNTPPGVYPPVSGACFGL